MGSSCTSCASRPTSTGQPEAMMEPVQPLPLQEYEIENCPLYVCKYDYDSRTDDDLGFKRGDLMYILRADEDGWWLARSKDSGKDGYIPSNYVVEHSNLDINYGERWYYGKLNCAKAEKLLMNSDPGSFLVRDSEVTPGNFVLSVQGVEGVNHYPIQYQWLGSGSYCVTQKASFASISDLVGYYHKPSGDLCSVLTFPCVMAEKPPTAGLSKQANKEWEIDWKQIRFLKKIGAGGFAEVWEGLWNMTMPVAIKTFKPGLLLVSEFLLEAEVIRKFFHPNLTPLYAVCTKEEPLYIITELMKHGSLLEFLRCKESRSLEHSQLIDMAAQVASGMAYLEEKNYVHRELAARNVLVGENLICKVTDFGFTKFVDDDYMIHRVSIKWTAPEALLYNRFTIKSDVWSFGIVLYEIITYGRIPYPGIATSGILEAVSEGTYRMPCPPNCPIQLYDIMLDCWKHELDNRPSFKTLQLLLEEFFSNSCEQKAQPN